MSLLLLFAGADNAPAPAPAVTHAPIRVVIDPDLLYRADDEDAVLALILSLN